MNGAQRGDFTYRLGAAGNRTNLVDNVSGTIRTNTWSYDNLYRLTSESISNASPTGTLGYVYDDAGNRTSRTGTLGILLATNNTFDVNDWLDNDSITNNANAYFDANGNTRTNGTIYYGYDWANRLTASTNSSTVVTIVYDADGNRIKKTTSTTTNLYLVAAVNPTGYPQVVEELTVSGSTTNLSRVYAYGLDLISQRQISGTVVTFYGYDGLGSIRFLTEATGAITNTYAYDAYGTVIASNAPVANVYLYAGEQYDPDLGLYFLRARYYAPNAGRFWTMDDEEGDNQDPLSLHKYLYCSDNSVNRIDPSGHGETLAELNISGALVAGLAGFTAASVYEAKTHAIGTLTVAAWNEATAMGASATEAAESALSVFRKSVRELVEEAKNILRRTGRLLKQTKVIPMPKSVIRDVANHVATAQASGYLPILTRVSPAVAAANRRAATTRLGPAGLGKSWDEYPFASGRPRGSPASVVAVPWIQNSIQGGIISACYRLEKINVGTPYIVVVTP